MFNKYGPKTVVFIRHGSFVDLMVNPEQKEYINEIGEILNCTITFMKESNYFLLGFSDNKINISKNVRLLNNNGFVVVLYSGYNILSKLIFYKITCMPHSELLKEGMKSISTQTD